MGTKKGQEFRSSFHKAGMKTRVLYTDFWNDNYVSNLNGKEKLVFIYLITNKFVSICGIYQIPDKYIKLDCDLSQSELEAIKEKLTRDGKFFFNNGWVRIMNYTKFNSYKGEKVEKAIESEMALVPSVMIQYRYSMDRVSATADTPNNHINNILINNNNTNTYYNKGTSYSSIKDLTNETLQEIADKYKVPLPFVLSRLDDMKNWMDAKGKKYKNYKAALMNWVKSDAMKIVMNQPVNKFGVTKV